MSLLLSFLLNAFLLISSKRQRGDFEERFFLISKVKRTTIEQQRDDDTLIK